jgi:hypothetical protein
MGLNYNLSKISNWKTVCLEGQNLNACTQALLWASLQVGMPTITAKNFREFFSRISEVEQAFGAMRGNDVGPMFFTETEIEAHIGLSVNVRPETRAAFNRRMKKAMAA